MRLAAVAVAFLLLAPSASAQKAKPRKVAFAPLNTLGTDAASKAIRSLSVSLHSQLSQIAGFTVIPERTLTSAIASSGQPALQACQGEPSCLAEIGLLVGAEFVVAGEVGGLGDAQVVYLRLVDSKSQRVIRATTLELTGTKADVASTRGAAIRLLSPNDYAGLVDVIVDVDGASIFVDGERLASSPSKPLRLPAGSHALRVTHPEFRDFVRFIEVDFGKVLPIKVDLHRFPVVASDIRRENVLVPATGPTRLVPTPWYKSWYVGAGIGAVVLTTSAIIFAAVANDISSDASRKIDVPTR